MQMLLSNKRQTFLCVMLRLGVLWMLEGTHGQCTWTGLAGPRAYSSNQLGYGSNTGLLRNRIKSLNGNIASEITGLITEAALPTNTHNVFFAVPHAGDTLEDTEKVALQNWLSAGNTLVITGDLSSRDAFNRWMNAIGGVQCNDSKEALTPFTASTLPGMENEDLTLATPLDSDSLRSFHNYCALESTNEQVKQLVAVNDADVILTLSDATTGLPYGGRIIYMGSRIFWYSEIGGSMPGDSNFLTELVTVACSSPPPVPELFDRDWQIVPHPDEGILSSLNEGNGDLSVTQKFYSTGQQHVRYKIFQDDCVTVLPNGSETLAPTVQIDDSSDTTVLIGQFDLDLAVLASSNAVWTGTETSGTVEICTVVELLSEEEASATSESLFMLETIVTLTVDMVAQIVTARAMDVNDIGNAKQSSSSAAVGNVEACQCEADTSICYTDINGEKPAPLLRQGRFLHICFTFPNGFEAGTVRKMDVSQPSRGAAGGTTTSVQVIGTNGNIVRNGLTSVLDAQEAAPTDIVIKTMLPIDFFRYKQGEDRSTSLPPITVSGEIALGVVAPARRRWLKNKDRSHHVDNDTDGSETADGVATDFYHSSGPEVKVSDAEEVRSFVMQVNVAAVKEIDSSSAFSSNIIDNFMMFYYYVFVLPFSMFLIVA